MNKELAEAMALDEAEAEIAKAGDEWPPPRRLTPIEITALARDVITNVVFITNKPESLELSFSIVLALALPKMSNETIQQIGAIYAPLADAGPRSINGLPFFFSGKLLHIDDIPALTAEMQRMSEALGLIQEAPE